MLSSDDLYTRIKCSNNVSFICCGSLYVCMYAFTALHCVVICILIWCILSIALHVIDVGLNRLHMCMV